MFSDHHLRNATLFIFTGWKLFAVRLRESNLQIKKEHTLVDLAVQTKRVAIISNLLLLRCVELHQLDTPAVGFTNLWTRSFESAARTVFFRIFGKIRGIKFNREHRYSVVNGAFLDFTTCKKHLKFPRAIEWKKGRRHAEEVANRTSIGLNRFSLVYVRVRRVVLKFGNFTTKAWLIRRSGDFVDRLCHSQSLIDLL